MLQVLYSIVVSIINSLGAIVSLIGAIPTYVLLIFSFINYMPPLITGFLFVIVSIGVIISIKKLVI